MSTTGLRDRIKEQIDQWSAIVCDQCGQSEVVQVSGAEDHFIDQVWVVNEYCLCPGCVQEMGTAMSHTMKRT